MQTERDLSTRLRVASYLDRTSLGIYLELIQAALSILSCCLYIAETYYEKIPQWMNILDILLCVIFLSDFILHVYLAEKKYQYVFSRYGMIDLLTVLPVLIGIGVTGLNSYRHLFFFLRPARVLRSVRILRFLPAATKSTAARRQMIFLVYSGVCLVFIFSGLFQYVENNSVLGSDITRNGIEHPFLPFHEAVYFMVILAYTVSFGDPIPSNWVGKLVTMSYIIVTALVIPLQIRKLIKILAMQKDGGWVSRSKKRPHYIVTGSVHPTNFANFLSDFFDTRQKHDRARIVVLSGAEATDDFDMIHLPYIENKIHWLLGSVLVPIDLKRSQTASASGAFIFANSTAADPNREDKLNILRALSLRKHNRSMPVSVQLIDSSWKAHVQENTIIPFALDEVKMNLLVWSTIYPGFSTLISNMLMWRLQIPLPLNPPEWLKEYAIGLNQTLVEIEIPHKYLSETFTAVVVDVYNQYGITVVGVRKSGATKVILAPLNIDLRMSVGDTFVLLADVTQLQQFADRRFLKDLLAPPKERTKLDGIPLLGKIARKNSEFLDSLRLDVEIDSTEAEEESMAVGEDRDMFFHEHFDQGNTPRKPRRRFPFLKSKTVAAINDIPRNASRHFMLMDLAGLAPTKLPTATPEIVHTRSLAECTITSLDPAVTQHIVLCGCPRSRFGLYHFMQPLMLPVKIGESQEPPLVVILSQDPPAPATWAEVAHMNNILYINGSGMKSEDLFAAGIERARSIVILSSSAISTPSVITRSKHGVSTIAEAADMVYSQDADVILTTRAIHSTLHTMKSDSVFTISEMVHTKTFNLLALHEGDDTEFFLSPGFASGYFYDAGITERLIYQCHEKKFLKDIFSKIFSTKHKKRSTFISQISVPEIEPLTYGNLFSWAVRRNMIPVGLYRPMGEDMGQGSDHFVTVNPPANTILSERDRIFVWCSVLNNKNYK